MKTVNINKPFTSRRRLHPNHYIDQIMKGKQTPATVRANIFNNIKIEAENLQKAMPEGLFNVVQPITRLSYLNASYLELNVWVFNNPEYNKK